MDDTAAPDGYVLGHTEGELRRLALQASIIDPTTRRFLEAAGIGPGMRVLDVGCGAGHVSFIAAELVGAAGEVVGVDCAEAAVRAATADATARGLAQVSFLVGDPAQMSFDADFDAVVGRFVLQFQPDPAGFLRAVAGHVRPGGVVAFHELDWTPPWSSPPSPTHDQVCGWARTAIERSGSKTTMGLQLHTAFDQAGLPEPELRMETFLAAGARSSLPLEHVAGLTSTLLPAMQEYGIATADDVGIDTLLSRMQAETLANGSVILGRRQVGAWATTSLS